MLSAWLRNFRTTQQQQPEEGPAPLKAREFADSVNARCVMPTVLLLDRKISKGGEVSGGRDYRHGADVASTSQQARIAPSQKLRRAK